MTRPSRAWLIAMAISIAAAPACALRSTLRLPADAHTTERDLVLHGADVRLHLSAGANASRPLTIYFTGDGGWSGSDLEVYERLVSWGYPVVGVSSPDYLTGLNEDDARISVAALADDLVSIIRAGRSWRSLPAAEPVALVGVSRGADLMVAAAGESRIHTMLRGVVALGLTEEEEYVQAVAPDSKTPELDLFSYLPRLGRLRLAVVQSTRDRYVPAEEARRRFGPNTQRRRLLTVVARDHSFSDARERMFAALRSALRWVDRSGASPVP